MVTETSPKSEGKQDDKAPEAVPAPAATVAPVVLPPVEVDRDAMNESRAVASALVALAETRSHRAAKLVDTGDLDGLREEVGAIEDLLKKIAKELA